MSTNRVKGDRAQAVNEVVGDRIRTFRQRLNMSRKDLGEKLGVTYQQIQKYEDGSDAIPSHRIPDLCHHLFITPDHMFGEEVLKPGKRPVKHPIEFRLSPFATQLAIDIDNMPASCRTPLRALVTAMGEVQL